MLAALVPFLCIWGVFGFCAIWFFKEAYSDEVETFTVEELLFLMVLGGPVYWLLFVISMV